MKVEFEPLSDAIGVRLEGVDLHVEQPTDVRRAVRAAWLDHALVLVRGQDLDVDARHVYDYRNDHGTQRFRIATAPQAPTATHPVVLPHPSTHRPLLFVNELMTDSIVGLADGESEDLLHELWSYLDDPAVRYE